MAAESRLRAALATVEAADTAGDLADLPGLLLPALSRAFGADSVLWTEVDRSGPRRIASYPGPLLDREASAALERHAPEFPLTRHTRPGGDGRPIRRSDLQSLRSFRNSGVYADVARELGIVEMLAMSITPAGLHVCVCLNRGGADFTPAEVDLLTQLRPLLTRRVERLAAPRASSRPDSPASPAGLTGRQQEVLGLVAAGLTDAAIGRRLGCSPRTVDKHLEHVYRRLGVTCRAAAIATAAGLAADS